MNAIKVTIFITELRGAIKYFMKYVWKRKIVPRLECWQVGALNYSHKKSFWCQNLLLHSFTIEKSETELKKVQAVLEYLILI